MRRAKRSGYSATWVSNPWERRAAWRNGFLWGLLLGCVIAVTSVRVYVALHRPIVIHFTATRQPPAQHTRHEYAKAPDDTDCTGSADPEEPSGIRGPRI